MIHHGDCLEVMAGFAPESVDAVVTDPPYGLEFMGKEWDKLDGGLPQEAVWKGRRGRGGSSIGTDDSKPQSRHHVGYGGTQQGFKRCSTCGKRAFSGSPCQCAEPVWVIEYAQSAPSSAIRMGRWHQQWAEAAYRVAKPSAYLLAFGGTRTVHRMTVAIEDAGWIIRDMLVWAYASGFPKSKASLKPAWEPIVMARKPGPLRMLAIDECRIPSSDGTETARGRYPVADDAPAGMGKGLGMGGNGSPLGRWPANILLTDPIFDGGWEGVVGGGTVDGQVGMRARTPVGFTVGPHEPGQEFDHGVKDSGTYSRFFSIPTSRSDALSGIIGTCQICGAPIAETPSTARTPRPDTAPPSAATPLPEHPAQPASDAASPSPSPATAIAPRRAPTLLDGMPGSTASAGVQVIESDTNGTAPSTSPEPEHAIASPLGQPARTAELPPTSTDTTTTTAAPWMCGRCADDATHGRTLPPPRLIGREPQPDEASYTRFLIIPKADRTDREPVLGGLPERALTTHGTRAQGPLPQQTPQGPIRRANHHPTVKPVDLMRHLVRLVTPTGGIVLDPFLGSGTTAIAAEMEGFAWIGIEKEAEYVAIAEARLNGTQRGLGLPA